MKKLIVKKDLEKDAINSSKRVNKAWKIVPKTQRTIINNLNFLYLSKSQDITKDATIPATLETA